MAALHPYRVSPAIADEPRRRDTPHEEIVLAVALVVIGGARVLASCLTGRPIGAEATLALAMFVFGVASGVRAILR